MNVLEWIIAVPCTVVVLYATVRVCGLAWFNSQKQVMLKEERKDGEKYIQN